MYNLGKDSLLGPTKYHVSSRIGSYRIARDSLCTRLQEICHCFISHCNQDVCYLIAFKPQPFVFPSAPNSGKLVRKLERSPAGAWGSKHPTLKADPSCASRTFPTAKAASSQLSQAIFRSTWGFPLFFWDSLILWVMTVFLFSWCTCGIIRLHAQKKFV